jgi:hypothetical protein
MPIGKGLAMNTREANKDLSIIWGAMLRLSQRGNDGTDDMEKVKEAMVRLRTNALDSMVERRVAWLGDLISFTPPFQSLAVKLSKKSSHKGEGYEDVFAKINEIQTLLGGDSPPKVP